MAVGQTALAEAGTLLENRVQFAFQLVVGVGIRRRQNRCRLARFLAIDAQPRAGTLPEETPYLSPPAQDAPVTLVVGKSEQGAGQVNCDGRAGPLLTQENARVLNYFESDEQPDRHLQNEKQQTYPRRVTALT